MKRKSPEYHAHSKISQNMKSQKKAKKQSRSTMKAAGMNTANDSPMKGSGPYLDDSFD